MEGATLGARPARGQAGCWLAEAPRDDEMPLMRPVFLALVLAVASTQAMAQWEIFAETTPPDGSWATYRVTRRKGAANPTTSEIRISSRDGTVVEGTPCVWLEIAPVKWLGSRNRGRLSFLIPRAMDAEKASRLLFVSREILFTDPEKGPWFMRPEDVTWLTDKVSLASSCSSTPDGREKADDGKGQSRDCERRKLRSRLSIDPPFASAQVTEIEGKVWRDTATPFAVVRAEWTETQRKGGEASVETKTMELLEYGRDPAPPPPIQHGEGFSLWRLISR